MLQAYEVGTVNEESGDYIYTHRSRCAVGSWPNGV